MLQTLRLRPARVEGSKALPPFLSPLVRAAECGADLVPEILALTRQIGFDSFTYRTAARVHPDEESRIFEFTTLPAVWAIRYDQYAYVEVDPRVIETWDRTVPMLWDQRIARANRPRARAFLEDALSQGIASGVCMPLYDEAGTRTLVEFDSSIPIIKGSRKTEIRRALGDMFIFGKYFHELFSYAAIARRIPARNAGMPLSARERECLAMAAQGIAIDAIGAQLDIDPRLVQSHFDSIRSKLDVSNSREAIAQGINQGLFDS